MLKALINGSLANDPAHALSVEERGLAYGDGVFETMLLHDGAVRFVDDHLARLRLGCAQLGINAPDINALWSDVAALCSEHREGIVKLIVTRGAGGRGYRASPDLEATRIALWYPPTAREHPNGIAVRWCATRLARNAQLAGIKHLNRLEQVLARNEWNDERIADGLLLDTEGEVVESTASNVFAVIDGVLTTPDLRFCGVRGVLRRRVLGLAGELKIECEEGVIHPDELLRASEVFLTNAIRGIQPVRKLEECEWRVGPVTQALMNALRFPS